jgi:hypothetical protein
MPGSDLRGKLPTRCEQVRSNYSRTRQVQQLRAELTYDTQSKDRGRLAQSNSGVERSIQGDRPDVRKDTE